MTGVQTCALPICNPLGEDFVLDETGIGRDKNRKIFGNVILAGKDGLTLGLKNDSAFAAGALFTTYSIENNTSQPRGLQQRCAGVNGNLPAVGLKGNGKMLHFLDRY